MVDDLGRYMKCVMRSWRKCSIVHFIHAIVTCDDYQFDYFIIVTLNENNIDRNRFGLTIQLSEAVHRLLMGDEIIATTAPNRLNWLLFYSRTFAHHTKHIVYGYTQKICEKHFLAHSIYSCPRDFICRLPIHSILSNRHHHRYRPKARYLLNYFGVCFICTTQLTVCSVHRLNQSKLCIYCNESWRMARSAAAAAMAVKRDAADGNQYYTPVGGKMIQLFLLRFTLQSNEGRRMFARTRTPSRSRCEMRDPVIIGNRSR